MNTAFSVILVLKFMLVLVFVSFSLNHFYFYIISVFSVCLQCFDAVGRAAGRASGL